MSGPHTAVVVTGLVQFLNAQLVMRYVLQDSIKHTFSANASPTFKYCQFYFTPSFGQECWRYMFASCVGSEHIRIVHSK